MSIWHDNERCETTIELPDQEPMRCDKRRDHEGAHEAHDGDRRANWWAPFPHALSVGRWKEDGV